MNEPLRKLPPSYRVPVHMGEAFKQHRPASPPRELGTFRGQFKVPDDFDDEDPEILALFYGP